MVVSLYSLKSSGKNNNKNGFNYQDQPHNKGAPNIAVAAGPNRQK